MGSTALATAVNAGFSALASQAAVAMVNNQGDIGKTLEQLGKEESIKNLALTMATAGALDKLGGSMGWNQINAKSDFIDQLQKNLGNNIATDMINSALDGKPFNEESLQRSLTNALITSGMAYGANAIGDAYSGKDGIPPSLNDFTHKLAHAVLGCAGGAASQGSMQGCAPGAVGAVVGELTAEYAKDKNWSNEDALALAKTLSAVSGVLVGGGGNNAQAVNTAATTGGNAAQNNYLSHPERNALNNAKKACYSASPSAAACQIVTTLELKDKLSDKLLANAVATCEGGECETVSSFIQKQMANNGCQAGPVVAQCSDYNALQRYWLIAKEKAQGLEPVYPETWILDAKAALDLAKFGISAARGAVAGRGSLDALVSLEQKSSSLLGKADSMLPDAELLTNRAIGANGLTTPVPDLEVIGAGNGLGRPNLINPAGRTDNCTACVAANILNKMKGNPADGLVTAQQVEANFGYVGAEAKLSMGDSVAYIEKVTNTTAVKTPIAAPNAPVGYYAVYAETANGGHVIYGQVLPNGRYFFYDPQIGSVNRPGFRGGPLG